MQNMEDESLENVVLKKPRTTKHLKWVQFTAVLIFTPKPAC